MAPGSEDNHRNYSFSSFPLSEQPTATKRHQSTTSTRTLSSPSLPTLPFELVEEILCRLPVKTLLQLRCICKSWKSLISNDHKFAKKHLLMSKICQHQHHLIGRNTMKDSRDIILWHYPIPSVFSDISNPSVTLTQLNCPVSVCRPSLEISSCDGILCFTIAGCHAILWNPSIRRHKVLPPLENQQPKRDMCSFEGILFSLYSVGYDHLNDVYKVVAISLFKNKNCQVNVHTLGTDYWRRIQCFPYSRFITGPGVFVRGTVNWLAFDVSGSSSFHVIVSLDLEKESCQKLSHPDLHEGGCWFLGVLKDCLCIFVCSNTFLDVWIMKEYGNKETWTKWYNIPPYLGNSCVFSYTKAIYISEYDQVLIDFHEPPSTKSKKLAVYDSKKGTSRIHEIQNINGSMVPEVYVESLISPCS